jgi:dTDP-glucose pyrophosphorylase
MKTINVVIPMAGLGSRFAIDGYALPKPFIDVKGQPMIMNVLDNLNIKNAKYILIIRQEHFFKYMSIVDKIKCLYNVEFVLIDNITEGSACTVLFSKNIINNESPLLIANSDQIIDIDINNFIDDAIVKNSDGSILTFVEKSEDSKWSYIKLNDSGIVIQTKEKKAISNIATVGIYYFKKGSDFVDSALDMILNMDKTNGEYYTCPVYNYLIKNNKLITYFNIEKDQMHGIGTPEDLNNYLKYF